MLAREERSGGNAIGVGHALGEGGCLTMRNELINVIKPVLSLVLSDLHQPDGVVHDRLEVGLEL